MREGVILDATRSDTRVLSSRQYLKIVKDNPSVIKSVKLVSPTSKPNKSFGLKFRVTLDNGAWAVI